MTAYTFTVEMLLGNEILASDGTILYAPDGEQILDPSSWADVTPDVLRAKPITAQRGMTGNSPTDRVAPPGRMNFSLDNGESNAAGTLGYYAPDHTARRAGFVEGTRVRLKIVSGAVTRYKWHGRTTGLPAEPDQFGARETKVTAQDYMAQFASQKLKRIPVQQDKRTDQLIALVLAKMPIQPLATDLDTGPETFPYSMHDEQDERTFSLTALQKMAQSDMGYIYVKGDATTGEVLTYESRSARTANLDPQYVVDNTMVELQTSRSVQNVFNDVKVPVTPVTLDTVAVVLATNPNEIQINAGASVTITMRYVDPTGAGRRISGVELVTPVANTDYKFSASSGSGNGDINSSLSVAYEDNGQGGNSADVTYTNNGGVTGYLQANAQIRGKGVYLYDAQEATAEDEQSQLVHGDRVLTYAIPYQDSFNQAQSFAEVLLERFKEPFTNVEAVTFYADADDGAMTAALTLDIGDRISLVENATGLLADFFINGVEYRILRDGSLRVTWVLERASIAPFGGVLDSETLGLLDLTCYLNF